MPVSIHSASAQSQAEVTKFQAIPSKQTECDCTREREPHTLMYPMQVWDGLSKLRSPEWIGSICLDSFLPCPACPRPLWRCLGQHEAVLALQITWVFWPSTWGVLESKQEIWQQTWENSEPWTILYIVDYYYIDHLSKPSICQKTRHVSHLCILLHWQ